MIQLIIQRHRVDGVHGYGTGWFRQYVEQPLVRHLALQWPIPKTQHKQLYFISLYSEKSVIAI